jgi:hypothetical protein
MRKKKTDPIKERAKHHLHGFLETIAVRSLGFDGHFQGWVEARKPQQPDPIVQIIVDDYVAAFFRILEAAAKWGKDRRASERQLMNLDRMPELKLLSKALNEESEIKRSANSTFESTFDAYIPAGTLSRNAGEHLLRYLNAIILCGPVHWTCPRCGKLAMTRPGSKGNYCSNRCRRESLASIRNWKTPDGDTVQALFMQEWRANRAFKKIREKLAEENPKQDRTRQRLKVAKEAHDAKLTKYEAALKLAKQALRKTT